MKKIPIALFGFMLATPLLTATPTNNRVFIKIAYNVGFSEESKSTSWIEKIYYEDASYGVNYKHKKGNSINLGIGYKFSSSFGLELGADISSRNLDANFNASIPHPVLFNAPRSSQGTGGYKVTENAAFFNIIFSMPFSKFSFDIFGGPAYFFASCVLIKAIDYSDPFPHKAITLNVSTEKQNKNVFGFNGGASFNFYLIKNLAIFVSAHYLSGEVEFKPNPDIPGLKLSLGGLKAGGGIRILF